MGITAIEGFFHSEECFNRLIVVMNKKSKEHLQLSEAENFLQGENRELVKTIFEEFIAKGGTGDVGPAVINAKGVCLRQKRIRVRKLKTIFGTINIRRTGYSDRQEESVFPRDAELNLGRMLYSHNVRRKVALEVIRSSFATVSEAMFENFALKIHTSQIESIAISSAIDFEKFYEDRNGKATASLVKNSPLLVISVDGKGIVMRRQDLREATRKRAENTNHKFKHRLSSGEKLNSKRMATVAAVYNIDRFIRLPADLVGDLSREDLQVEPLKRPKPVCKRVWASIERDSLKVIHEAFTEAKKRDPKGEKEWVALVDGDPRQLRRVRKQIRKFGMKATVILDIIHVIEYLWDAARVFFEESSQECELWVQEKLLNVLQGNPGHVAAGIRRSATLKKIKIKDRKPVDLCARYLLKYSPYMNYSEYLRKGYPVATGAIEGACRHLIKDRMDITGARWSLTGAESIIKLRSIKSSRDFEEYWRFHETQEYVRNYGLNYWGHASGQLQA